MSTVAVIGAGVVGCAVASELGGRGVQVTVLEAGPRIAGGASAANSGILHTGFDSKPGELETTLILRAGELRRERLAELGVEVLHCGARMTPRDAQQRAAVAALHENARTNGVETELRSDGALDIPDEAVTDPVAFAEALAGRAVADGAELRLRTRVSGLEQQPGGAVALSLERSGDPASERGGGADRRLRVDAAVNCAGLYADEIAGMAGDRSFAIYPRKGEFLVFEQPAGAEALVRILLPVGGRMGKGVLVFPTVDGHVIAGPTAREREDKQDWSVEDDAAPLILGPARQAFPALEQLEPLCSYAGLRPAGHAGVNYAIEFSQAIGALLHVAAIRSTGLSASLGIAEHVAGLLEGRGLIERNPPARRPRSAGAPGRGFPAAAPPWWRRAAQRSAATAASER
jgi:glycerol-3-phosphate dehydrogenase